MAMINGGMAKYFRHQKQQKKPRQQMQCYRNRGEVLSEIGYSNYQEYLKSAEWQKIRRRKLDCHPACLLCRKPASQVHHLSYEPEALLGLDEHLLVSVCDSCHGMIEFDGERKRSLAEANATIMGQLETAGRNVWIRHFVNKVISAALRRGVQSRNRYERRELAKREQQRWVELGIPNPPRMICSFCCARPTRKLSQPCRRCKQEGRSKRNR